MQHRLRSQDQQLQHINKILNSEDIENAELKSQKDCTIVSDTIPVTPKPKPSSNQLFHTPRPHRVITKIN